MFINIIVYKLVIALININERHFIIYNKLLFTSCFELNDLSEPKKLLSQREGRNKKALLKNSTEMTSTSIKIIIRFLV